MPANERPTLTITIELDNGEKVETQQQVVDYFAEHPPFAAPFYSAIGKLVIQHGYVERLLSMALAKCRNLETERSVLRRLLETLGLKRVPRDVQVRKGKILLGRKIKLIRDLLRYGRLFGEPSEDPLWSGILDAARDIAKKRNDIMHGVVTDFEEGPPARILLQSADNPGAQQSSYTLQELEDIIRQMQEVHLCLGGLNSALGMDSAIREARAWATARR